MLAEALASRSDPRRLHDMFGLSIRPTHRRGGPDDARRMADTLPAMGILQDYFRAPNTATAIEWTIGPGGDWHQHSGTGLDDHSADWFDAKNLDPNLMLGYLIAVVNGVPFDSGVAGPLLVWPDERSWPPGGERPGQESPWEVGLFLQQLPIDWVTALANIQDEQLPLVALGWMECPEAGFTDYGFVQTLVGTFRALAERALAQDHGVYCKTVI